MSLLFYWGAFHWLIVKYTRSDSTRHTHFVLCGCSLSKRSRLVFFVQHLNLLDCSNETNKMENEKQKRKNRAFTYRFLWVCVIFGCLRFGQMYAVAAGCLVIFTRNLPNCTDKMVKFCFKFICSCFVCVLIFCFCF